MAWCAKIINPITIKIILWNDYYTFKNKYGTETYSSLIINNYLRYTFFLFRPNHIYKLT